MIYDCISGYFFKVYVIVSVWKGWRDCNVLVYVHKKLCLEEGLYTHFKESLSYRMYKELP